MIIADHEFGEIIIRKNPLSRGIKFSVNNSGRLQISAPQHTPNFIIKNTINTHRNLIRAKLPVQNPANQRARDQKVKLLKKSAQDFLPYRLEYLAKLHGFHYQKLRLSYPATRWGSCTTTGVISLNIGLMQIPSDLRDYVILHELAHLKHPDHSIAFWRTVEKMDPKYRYHRERLKHFNPGIF